MEKRKWLVMKINTSSTHSFLGVEKEGTSFFPPSKYDVLGTFETEIEAYEVMKVKAKELNIHGMRYPHLR
jgi:hypothetical protein